MKGRYIEVLFRRMGEGRSLPFSLANGFHEKALSVKADVAALAVLEGP